MRFVAWLRQKLRGIDSWNRWNRILVSASVLLSLLLTFHGVVPNAFGRLGSLLETFLPWVGLFVPVLLFLALLRRSVFALCAALLPAVSWAFLFGGLWLSTTGPDYDITAIQHNVSDENEDPSGTAKELLKAGAELIALEELTPSALPDFDAALASRYPHRATIGTVGLWSKFPLADVRRVDIKPQGIGEG